MKNHFTLKHGAIVVLAVLLVGTALAWQRERRRANKSEGRESSFRYTNHLRNANGPEIVFMGDSITFFWNLPEHFRSFPYTLENCGLSGDRSELMISRFHDDVVSIQPLAVVIQAGINDLYHDKSADVVKDNLEIMTRLAHHHGIHVILGTIHPLPKKETEAPRQSINRWIRRYCQGQTCRTLDIDKLLSDHEGAPLPRYFRPDKIHLSEVAYAVLTQEIKKEIEMADTRGTR